VVFLLLVFEAAVFLLLVFEAAVYVLLVFEAAVYVLEAYSAGTLTGSISCHARSGTTARAETQASQHERDRQDV